MITMVYPININPIWPETAALLAPAVDISGTHDVEDVRRSLMGNQSQLWVQWNAGVDAAVVTEFINYPKGLWCRFWLAGAKKGVEIAWDKFFETLYKFARDNRCVGIEDCGRGGWDRYAPQAKKISTLRRILIDYGGNNGQ